MQMAHLFLLINILLWILSCLQLSDYWHTVLVWCHLNRQIPMRLHYCGKKSGTHDSLLWLVLFVFAFLSFHRWACWNNIPQRGLIPQAVYTDWHRLFLFVWPFGIIFCSIFFACWKTTVKSTKHIHCCVKKKSFSDSWICMLMTTTPLGCLRRRVRLRQVATVTQGSLYNSQEEIGKQKLFNS